MQPRKVLAVDDSKLMLQMYQLMLRQYPLAVASDGREALSRLAEHPDIDLVLLDINMPVMNGEVFARTLRGREDLDDVRVLVVTAEHSPFRHARLRQIGVDWILTKPFFADHLLDAIRRCLPSAEVRDAGDGKLAA